MQKDRRSPVDSGEYLRNHPALKPALVTLAFVVAAGAFAWGLRAGLDRGRQPVVPIPPGPAVSTAPPAKSPAPAVAPAAQPEVAAPGAGQGGTATAAEQVAKPAAKPPAAPKTQPQPEAAVWPYQGGILKPFGWTYSATMEDWRFHQGMDIAGNEGDEVVAAMAGRVESVSDTSMYGVRIVVLSPSGTRTVYSNCKDVLVREGDTVKASQPIASIGKGAFECLDPDHLHFEVITGKGPIDPSGILR